MRKHRPELIVWAAFGVAVAGLPGQAFVISGGIWQQTMFWPVFLGALVPVSQRGRVALGILALFQLSHPAGVLLLLIATLAALSVESQDASLLRAQLGKFVQLGMLFLIACSKAAWGFWPALTGDPLWMPWDGIIAAFNEGSPGAPILGLLAMWFAAFTPFFQSRAVRRLGLLAVLAAGALWAWWAISPGRWAAAVHYRSWAVPAALPFLWCALLAARRSLDLPVALSGRLNVEKPELRLSFEFTPAKPRTDYYLLAVSAALVFCAVITLQSLGWKAMVARLNSEVSSRPGPVVTREAIPFIRQTPLDHWSITALCALHSGSRPEKYVAFSDGKITTPDGGKILLGPNHFIPAAPGPAGWFDHRPLLERLAAEKR